MFNLRSVIRVTKPLPSSLIRRMTIPAELCVECKSSRHERQYIANDDNNMALGGAVSRDKKQKHD